MASAINYWFGNTERLILAKPRQDVKKKKKKERWKNVPSYMKHVVHLFSTWKITHENRTLTQWQRAKSHVPWWAGNPPCHYPSSIVTNIKFLPVYVSGQTKELWIQSCFVLMGRKQRLLLFRFLVTMNSDPENEWFALDLKQRWEPPPHCHLI